MDPAITVITVTRRPGNLPACCATIDGQRGEGPLRHLVLGDGVERPERWGSERHRDVFVSCSRGPGDRDGPARLAALRNRAVQLAIDETIVFLDDDNGWTPDHLASLVAARRATGVAFVHAERELLEPDGRPYLREEFPWARDPARRRHLWQEYRQLGIVAPGSNVWRDRLPMPASCVDLGAWLLPRGFLLARPFPTAYGQADWEANVSEDHHLAAAILASGLPVVSTGRATLRYRLGGYSNCFDPSASIHWRPEAASAARR
jgi:hypothetical protein